MVNTQRILEIANMLEKRQLPEGWAFNMHAVATDVAEIARDEAEEFVPSIPEINFTKQGDLSPSQALAYDCKSAACIAGHVIIKYHPELDPFKISNSIQLAENTLGLTDLQGGQLFCPVTEVTDWNTITPERAAHVLRHLAATGVVDWSIM